MSITLDKTLGPLGVRDWLGNMGQERRRTRIGILLTEVIISKSGIHNRRKALIEIPRAVHQLLIFRTAEIVIRASDSIATISRTLQPGSRLASGSRRHGINGD